MNMKKLFFLIFIFVVAFSAFAQNKLTVDVEIRTKENGIMRVGLYEKKHVESKKEDYLMLKKIGASKIKKGAYITVVFENVPDGIYGVRAYIDSNGNGKHNRRGLYPEPWGVSNSIRPGPRAPRWDEFKFDLNSDKKISFFVKEGISKK